MQLRQQAKTRTLGSWTPKTLQHRETNYVLQIKYSEGKCGRTSHGNCRLQTASAITSQLRREKPAPKTREKCRAFSLTQGTNTSIDTGDTVRTQSLSSDIREWQEATVDDSLKPESYVVKTDDRMIYRRNQHLREQQNSTHTLPAESEPLTVTV